VAVYVVRRLLIAVSVVVAVSFGAFVGFGLSFDPTYPLVAGGGHAQTRALVQAYYHLNDPIVERYWRWLVGFFHHGFGRTVSLDVIGPPPRVRTPGDPIGPRLWHAAGITAQLLAASLVLVVAGSALVGTIAARRRRFRVDVSTRAVAYFAAAVPTFMIGDLLARLLVPNETLTTGTNGRLTLQTSGGEWFLIGPPSGGVVGWIRHMTLPVLALTISLVGIYARYIRTALQTAFTEPFVTVARAKGLPERRVIVRHALRTSLVPFTSLLSLEMGGIVGASIAVDAVFNLGGLASTFLTSLTQGDPFELTALLVIAAILVCAFTFVGDLVVGLLDPRIASTR